MGSLSVYRQRKEVPDRVDEENVITSSRVHPTDYTNRWFLTRFRGGLPFPTLIFYVFRARNGSFSRTRDFPTSVRGVLVSSNTSPAPVPHHSILGSLPLRTRLRTSSMVSNNSSVLPLGVCLSSRCTLPGVRPFFVPRWSAPRMFTFLLQLHITFVSPRKS